MPHRRSTSAMLCEARRIAAPVRSRYASSALRTTSAVSGSSEAVGSSRSRRSGRLSSALASAARGLLSRRQRADGAIQQILDADLLGKRGNARVRAVQRVEEREHREILAHRQAVRHVHIGRGKIHSRERAMGPPPHVVAERRDSSRSRRDEAEQHPENGRLSRAVAAEQRHRLAAFDREAHPVDRQRRPESLGEIDDTEGGVAHRLSVVEIAPSVRLLTGEGAVHTLDSLPGMCAPAAAPREDGAMATTVISDSSFQSDVIESANPVLVDFWAEWCGPVQGHRPGARRTRHRVRRTDHRRQAQYRRQPRNADPLPRARHPHPAALQGRRSRRHEGRRRAEERPRELGGDQHRLTVTRPRRESRRLCRGFRRSGRARR